MSYKNYALISGIVFALVALLHMFRIAQGWEIVVAGSPAPLGASWIGLAISGVLAYFGLSLGCKKTLA